MERIIKTQNVHISKCLTSVEGPPKTKHVRGIILGSHDLQGADFFFQLVVPLNPQSNPIICYKFLFVLHKLLREGHPNCIKDAIRNGETIVKLGKLWSHMRDHYGVCIVSFTKLIVQKLKFHRKYPTVPGSLSLTGEQMAEMAGNNVNTLFELSVDLLDYMDEILKFQAAVFNSLDKSRSNSMTYAGQCRLIPVVQCVQDAACLYDILVKLLFRLHNMLPSDTLSGHRERFGKQYSILQRFFEQARHLQYFRNLIHIPDLPSSPPNFLVQSELAAHRAPIVTALPVAEEPDDDTPDMESSSTSHTVDLLDLSDFAPPLPPPQPQSQASTSSAWSNSPFGGDTTSQFSFNGSAAYERTRDLRLENEALKEEIEKLKKLYKEQLDSLRARIQSLENEVKSLVQLKSRLEEELATLRASKGNRERENQAYQEKFAKLKDAYTKLRNEHVDLLRKTATIQSQIEEEKQKCQAKEDELKSKAAELAHLEHERVAWAEMQQGVADSESRLHEAKTRLLDMQRRQRELEQECATWRTAKDTSEAKANEMRQEASHLERVRLEQEEKMQELQSRLREHENQAQADQEAEQRAVQQMVELRQRVDELRSESKRYEHLQPHALLRSQADACVAHLRQVVDSFADAEMSHSRGSAELLLSQIDQLITLHLTFQPLLEKYTTDDSCVDQVLCALVQLTGRAGDALLQLKAVSNGAESVEQTDQMLQYAQRLLQTQCQWLTQLPAETQTTTVLNVWADIRQLIASNVDLMGRSELNAEDVGDLVEQEMRGTAEAIEMAQATCQRLMEVSRAKFTGMHLEVNESILESCNALMSAVQLLVEKAAVLQREIVAEGRGTTSSHEFYKKNHRWTEGLISAAKSIALAANVLVKEADKVASGQTDARPEQLEICAREISASTVQLVVTSRVKANPRSFSLRQLMEASSSVTNATGRLVAAAKSAAEMLDRDEVLDFSKLSLTQAKMAEMESQVRVLQLEAQLTQERRRLGELRKHHYQLASEMEAASAENRS